MQYYTQNLLIVGVFLSRLETKLILYKVKYVQKILKYQES
jgi:hypothetical protein